MARAPRVPSSVLRIEVITAMIRLFCTAWCRALVSNNTPNHSNVKPVSGKAMMVEALKANSGSNTTGR